MKFESDLMAFLETAGEKVGPAESNSNSGQPEISLNEWIEPGNISVDVNNFHQRVNDGLKMLLIFEFSLVGVSKGRIKPDIRK